MKLSFFPKRNLDDVAERLEELAKEWRDKPLGRGVICVVVQDNGKPIIYGYGDCGQPLTELELARMKLFDFYLGND